MSNGIEDGKGGLGSRFLRSSLYMGVGGWLTYAINFAINIGIARLLGPAEFGLYALVFAVGEFLMIVGALSMQEALLNLREESQSLYDTAWAISAAQAATALAICIALAPLLAHYRSTEAAWFIITLGLARALNFLAVAHTAKVERALQYRRLALIGLVTANVPNLCALALAWNGFGAWSLILRDLMTSALYLALITLVSGYRIRFGASRESARSLMEFARPMLWARILDIVIERVDRIVVGLFFGDRTLGLYHQARYLAGFPALAARPLIQLAFNLYSRVRDNPDMLRRSFAIPNFFLTRFAAAVVVLFLVAPGETVQLLLGEEWAAAAPVLRALAGYAALVPILRNLKQLLFARAEALKNVRVRIGQAVIFLPGVLIAASYDSIAGVAAAVSLGTLFATSLCVYYNRVVVLQDLWSAVAAPIAVCGLTVGLFEIARRTGTLESVPGPLIPVLGPLVFVLLLVAAEPAALTQQFRYLVAQFRSGKTA